MALCCGTFLYVASQVCDGTTRGVASNTLPTHTMDSAIIEFKAGMSLESQHRGRHLLQLSAAHLPVCCIRKCCRPPPRNSDVGNASLWTQLVLLLHSSEALVASRDNRRRN